MYTVVVIFHILACTALILIVLLQTGRGAEMGAAFGGASQTLFGGSGGTTFMSKLTTAAAVVFMLTCLCLTYLSVGPTTKSVMENVPVEKSEGPLLPEAKPVQALPEPPAATQSAPKAQEAPVTQESPAVTEKQPPQAQEPAKAEKAAPSPTQGKQKEKAPVAPKRKQ